MFVVVAMVVELPMSIDMSASSPLPLPAPAAFEQPRSSFRSASAAASDIGEPSSFLTISGGDSFASECGAVEKLALVLVLLLLVAGTVKLLFVIGGRFFPKRGVCFEVPPRRPLWLLTLPANAEVFASAGLEYEFEAEVPSVFRAVLYDTAPLK